MRGVFPGTFDPPTYAHLAIAAAAVAQCHLEHIDLVVNAHPLGKSAISPLAKRTAMLEALATTRPWLRVLETDLRHLADIAEGYDVLVLGADKWAAVLDVRYYDSEAERDLAITRLPQLAVAPRDGLPLPPGCVCLEVDTADVSSTAARSGRVDLVPPEVHHLL